jgi:hypothetical protein
MMRPPVTIDISAYRKLSHDEEIPQMKKVLIRKHRPRKRLLLAVFALASSSMLGQECDRKRWNLPSYQFGGNLTISQFRDLKSQANLSSLRGFIWQKFQRKELGYITRFGGGKDKILASVTYYIEPDSKGRWVVCMVYDRSEVNWTKAGPKERPSDHKVYTAYSVERVSDNATDEGSPMDHLENSFRLRFKDSKGQLIWDE